MRTKFFAQFLIDCHTHTADRAPEHSTGREQAFCACCVRPIHFSPEGGNKVLQTVHPSWANALSLVRGGMHSCGSGKTRAGPAWATNKMKGIGRERRRQRQQLLQQHDSLEPTLEPTPTLTSTQRDT